MDRFEAMSMLVTVSEKGSLTAAGRALKVPLATLSRKISDLERLLGTRLVIRTTRKLTFTDAGLAYIAAARGILEQVAEAERQAAGEFVVPKGELVITAPILFGRLHVLPVVTDFLALFPEINIRLVLADRNVNLVDDSVDMAVRIGKLPDSSLVATRVGSMRAVLCASPTLLASHGEPRTLEDLVKFPWVGVDVPLPSLGWQPVESRLSVTTTEAAAQAAIRGVGIIRLLHYQVYDAVKAGDLRIILTEFEPEPLPVNLIHAARGNMPLKMRSFLDFAAPRLRAVVARISEDQSST